MERTQPIQHVLRRAMCLALNPGLTTQAAKSMYSHECVFTHRHAAYLNTYVRTFKVPLKRQYLKL